MLAEQPRANQTAGLGAASDDSFQLLFDANPVPMWIWDHETYRFLAVNDTAVAHYGYSRERFLSMPLFELKPPEDHGGIREIAQGSGGYQEGRVSRHIKADGGLIDVAIYGRSLNYRGRPASLVGAVDITARKRAEDEARSTREFLSIVIENVNLIRL
jgi:PAS domain S-box-containing protein